MRRRLSATLSRAHLSGSFKTLFKKEGGEVVTKCNHLKMRASDRKQYLVYGGQDWQNQRMDLSFPREWGCFCGKSRPARARGLKLITLDNK